MFPLQFTSPYRGDVWLPGNEGQFLCVPPSSLNCFLSFFVVQALLIDGYISQTFQSRAAEQYFLNLLKSSSIPPHTTLSYTSKGGYFFFVHSVPPHIPAPFPNSPRRWLLDRGIMDGGTVVPQMMWSSHSASDRRQHVEMGELQMPVFFEDRDGELGFSIEASVDGQYHGLRHANDLAPLGQKTTTHIRIIVSIWPLVGLRSRADFEIVHHYYQWPGYRTFKRQIPIRDDSSAHNPITMAKFLCQVGRTVDNFLRVRLLLTPFIITAVTPCFLGLRIRPWVCR
jgi:hypothetical protein